MFKNKKKKQQVANQRSLVRFAWTAVFVWLFVLTCLVAASLFIGRHNSGQFVDYKISQVEQSRYLRPLVDLASNKVLVYEAKLAIPLDQTTKSLRYDYRGDNIYFSVDSVIGHQNYWDKQNSPTCDKVVWLSRTLSEHNNPHYEYVGELPAIPNGYRYMYKHADCTFVQPEAKQRLVEAIQVAEGY